LSSSLGSAHQQGIVPDQLRIRGIPDRPVREKLINPVLELVYGIFSGIEGLGNGKKGQSYLTIHFFSVL
jgi:hypothetical protein